MALQRVKTVFDGRWIESSQYIDYRVFDVYVPVSSLFQEIVNCTQRSLFPTFELSVSRLTVYWTGCNNANLIWIVDDKDVSSIMLVILKFSNNDLLVVIDILITYDNNIENFYLKILTLGSQVKNLNFHVLCVFFRK